MVRVHTVGNVLRRRSRSNGDSSKS
ncbi:uncharacterized protein G2W53_017493 [Senna tora]|uniref:Uncharacterized protein n=1 Tax=Senna tora TaxID=362788 RepID=A0A834TRE2_9FABA|nr:uncharacterized protein G2W53_017493 [Senna tora]